MFNTFKLLIYISILSLPSLSSGQDTENILEKLITVNFHEKALAEAAKIISEQAGAGYALGADVKSYKGTFSIQAKNKPFHEVLSMLLKGTDITYTLVGNQIVFKAAKPNQQARKKYTISGYIKEEGSQELLIGVNVYLPGTSIGTVTNTYGFYSISLPASDSLTLVASFVGYKPVVITRSLSENVELNINLNPNIELGEVVITAEQNRKESESAQMSTINIPVQQIKSIPSLLGEKDVLKVIQLMPGVQKGGEGTSGFYVRGGSPDQNLIILDDAIVYNATHLFGFFSLFNGDALKSVELTKGGFPARYGGRLSSVLEMNMKEGNKQEWHGEAGIGLITSRFMIEGPLKKDKSSILVSGRRTYADLIALPFMGKEKIWYNFYDLNAKINYDFGRKNRLYLSGYFGRDKFTHKYEDEQRDMNYQVIGNSIKKTSLYYGNATATLRWNHLYNDKLFSNTSIVYSKYWFGVTGEEDHPYENKNYKAEYLSGIQDLSFKHDVDYLPGPAHSVKAGLMFTRHLYEPRVMFSFQKNDSVQLKQTSVGYEIAAYAEDTYTPFERLKINAGIRLSAFRAKQSNYVNLEPRISSALRLTENFAVKASYAEMNQYIHLISNTGVGLPTDLWVPATDMVKPQNSKQVAAGMVLDVLEKSTTFSVEGYYKKMNNIISYKEGSSFIDIDDLDVTTEFKWENNITSGKGKSYGLEFLLHRKVGKLTGWVGYTLSWTKFQFDSLNFGKEYFAKYDRRHDISIVAIYNPSPKITLSATWVYGTGNAITLPKSSYVAHEHNIDYSWSYYDMHYVKTFGQKNSFRMEPYHRLDIGIQFHKVRKKYTRTWEISFYNAYNRANPFYYYISGNSDPETNVTERKLKKVTIFPIIPSVTYSIKF